MNKTGSIGMPLPDVDCKIISLDDGETEMPLGEIGELVIHGPQVMKGYHNMPTETANSLRNCKDGKTWLFTGDIVRMDEDGYFYIVDRKKELIKPGGFQVWPREVEEAIAAYPKVLEVGVAGIPDPYRGETVKAWIVLETRRDRHRRGDQGLLQGTARQLQGPHPLRIPHRTAQDHGRQDSAARVGETAQGDGRSRQRARQSG